MQHIKLNILTMISKFITLPFSVKLNKLLLEAQYMGSAKIDDTVCVLYLYEKEYYEIPAGAKVSNKQEKNLFDTAKPLPPEPMLAQMNNPFPPAPGKRTNRQKPKKRRK